MPAGGFSTLEWHEHMHGAMIFRERGTCLPGTSVRAVAAFDFVTIPAWTWPQFRASAGEAFGFLCMVNRARDRPQLPDEVALAELRTFESALRFLGGAAGVGRLPQWRSHEASQNQEDLSTRLRSGAPAAKARQLSRRMAKRRSLRCGP